MHSILKFYTKIIFKFVHQIYYILINLKELKIRKKMGSQSSCLWNYFLISTVRLKKSTENIFKWPCASKCNYWTGKMAEWVKLFVAQAWCFEINPGTKVKVEAEKQPTDCNNFHMCAIECMSHSHIVHTHAIIFLKNVI